MATADIAVGPLTARYALPIALLAIACAQTGASLSPSEVSWETTRRISAPSIDAPADDVRAERAARRAAVAEQLGAPGVVLVFSSDGDGHGRYFEDDDFYYLSGVEIPSIALALQVGADGELLDEVLFLPPHSDMFERWNGERLAPGDAAQQATGFARTAEMPADDDAWAAALAELDAEVLHTLGEPLPFELPDGVTVVEREEDAPLPLRATLSRLRLVKSPYEVACLRAAIDITCAGLLDAIAAIRPGAHEYTAQAALEGTFLRLGSERPGFPSICGSGSNAVTLHYDKNRDRLEDGELIVMDVGAKYRYYCADVTRTVPVNGRFTERQREIYDVVLAAQTAAAEAARPGMTIRELDQVARDVITEAGFGDYFLHSVGHWLGLDVHDVGGRVPIEIDALFTIEPGIYIADEAIGVRIEDDYVMTADGAVRLSGAVPSDPDAIEALMAGLR